MRFAPHTGDDERRMLRRLGLRQLEDLYEAVPASMRAPLDLGIRYGHAEPEALERLRYLASRNTTLDDAVCFLGGGAYDHFVPAVVAWAASRSEFTTAYTPYQAELSQGLLQALFEFQTIATEVLGLPVANSSLYDGATALVEAVHLAATATRRTRVVVAGTLDPRMREVMDTYAPGLGIEVVVAPVEHNGTCDPQKIAHLSQNAAAVVVQHPNVVGVLEPVPALAEVAHDEGARLVVHFDVMLAGVLEPPGRHGADVVVADGLCVGNVPSFGGPGVGLMAVGERDVRLLPGRLVGETVDADGRTAYVLTMQAREQHIRRERATSNICTNQALNAIATGAYLSWLGPAGLVEMGERCLSGARVASRRLAAVGRDVGLPLMAFPDSPVGKEFALRVPDPTHVAAALAEKGLLVGPVTRIGGEDLLLVAVTEQRTVDQVERLAEELTTILATPRGGGRGERGRPDAIASFKGRIEADRARWAAVNRPDDEEPWEVRP